MDFSVEKDFLPQFFLFIGNFTAYLSILCFGILFLQRERYFRLALVLISVCVWNALLKQWFHIPLFPHLGEGYAFPSGHMHTAALFYGYWLLSIKKPWAACLCTFLLTGEAMTLIGCRFHNSFDIFGACGFTLVELWLIFHYEQRPFFERKLMLFIIACFFLWILTLSSPFPFWLWKLFSLAAGIFLGMNAQKRWIRYLLIAIGFALFVRFYQNAAEAHDIGTLSICATFGFLLTCLPSWKTASA